ncbi:MAG: hypothetical protein ACYCY5_09205 [Sulfuricella sp.]
MTDENVAQAGEDSAWISVDLPLSPGEVYTFIQKIERLFRLNPHLEIKSWQEDAPGSIYPGKQIRLDSLNEMNGMQQSMTLSVSDVHPDVSFSLSYDRGLKQATVFTVQGLTPASCRLVVKEHYPAQISAAEREARLNEVDKSLVPWGAAIRSYFIRRARWGWLPFFSWFQDAFWLKMPPRQRRIARLIIWTTALEFVVFLFVFVIYWLELGRGHL